MKTLHSTPEMPPLSQKRILASRVKESLQVYGKFLASDLINASIKSHIKKIHQCLWSGRKTVEGMGCSLRKGIDHSLRFQVFERRSRCYAVGKFERHRVHPAFGWISPRCQPPTRFERTCWDLEVLPRKPVSNRSLHQRPQPIRKENPRFSEDTSPRGEFNGVCFGILRNVPSFACCVFNVVLRRH